MVHSDTFYLIHVMWDGNQVSCRIMRSKDIKSNGYLSQRCPWRRGSGRLFKIHRGSGAAAVDFLKIHRGSGSIFFEDIEKVREFDRILVFTS